MEIAGPCGLHKRLVILLHCNRQAVAMNSSSNSSTSEPFLLPRTNYEFPQDKNSFLFFLFLLGWSLLGWQYFKINNLVSISVLNSPKLGLGFHSLPSLTAGPDMGHTCALLPRMWDLMDRTGSAKFRQPSSTEVKGRRLPLSGADISFWELALWEGTGYWTWARWLGQMPGAALNSFFLFPSLLWGQHQKLGPGLDVPTTQTYIFQIIELEGFQF